MVYEFLAMVGDKCVAIESVAANVQTTIEQMVGLGGSRYRVGVYPPDRTGYALNVTREGGVWYVLGEPHPSLSEALLDAADVIDEQFDNE